MVVIPFLLRKAAPEDLSGVMAVMDSAVETTRPREWFVPDGPDYLAVHLDGKQGFILIAEAVSGRIAAYLMVHFPGPSPENLGYSLGFSQKALQQSAHMDSTAVLPAFRGNRLQRRLLVQAEQELAKMGYCHLLATVHPDNRYSLQSFLAQGYHIAATLPKYGGLPRHILHKEIAQPKGG